MELNYFALQNGIRVVHKATKNDVAHCGFVINTGSRDEKRSESGIAHFIEHAIFKGTKKRKAFHILNRIDNVGGEINAYTTKESTSIYASFTKNYLDRATELLTDILFNSTYPEKELEKEKDVIIDEIYSYQDTPFEQIYDDFEALIFKNHPLEMNILGTVDSVKKITRENILSFITANYATNEIVFSIVGDFSLGEIQKVIHKYLEPIPVKNIPKKREKFTSYSTKNHIVEKDVQQTHCIIGNIAYSDHHKNKSAFILLNNILGGPAMNSRLNMGIREKYGFAYNIESNYTTYSDTGLFNLYLGTDSKHIEKSIHLVHKELKKLRNQKLSPTQLSKSKQQLIGQITLSEENNCNTMLGMGKSLLLYNKIDDISTVHKKINALTATELQDIANEIFNEQNLSSLIFQPIK